MTTAITREGKHIEIISACELRDPLTTGTYIRAYCHIHGSDHQRSLSINRTTGWGHCFNAACQATVLVEEWNPTLAARLIRFSDYHASSPHYYEPVQARTYTAHQLPLFLPIREIPHWQQDELATLQALQQPMHRSFLTDPHGQAYLKARRIPLDLALATGISYVSPGLFKQLPTEDTHNLRRWRERIVFPLVSPEGIGFIGRSLWGWRAGMDENGHKQLLDQPNRPRRWLKTNPAGWFSCDLDQLAERIILVEGGFDRLTLLQAGFRPTEVVALAGTAAHVDWLPPHVRAIVLALDGDQGGQEASSKLADEFQQAGLIVRRCLLPQDRWGKDWNERWRTLGRESVQPLIETYREMRVKARSA